TPLCTRPQPSDPVGCAFSSESLPCVAHLVCPMPTGPLTTLPATAFSRLASLPTLRRTSICPARRTATPAESYPPDSRRLRPSKRMGTATCFPTYPTMPHNLLPFYPFSPFFPP